jgi:hypothetical protein
MQRLKQIYTCYELPKEFDSKDPIRMKVLNIIERSLICGLSKNNQRKLLYYYDNYYTDVKLKDAQKIIINRLNEFNCEIYIKNKNYKVPIYIEKFQQKLCNKESLAEYINIKYKHNTDKLISQWKRVNLIGDYEPLTNELLSSWRIFIMQNELNSFSTV